MTINQKLETASQIIETACRIYAPKDTGNLSINAIRTVYENGTWQVVIGGEVAPYAIYTNEEWINRGTENPNEHWIEKAVESVRGVLINIFTDSYTPEELNLYQNKLNKLADKTILKRIRGVIK